MSLSRQLQSRKNGKVLASDERLRIQRHTESSEHNPGKILSLFDRERYRESAADAIRHCLAQDVMELHPLVYFLQDSRDVVSNSGCQCISVARDSLLTYDVVIDGNHHAATPLRPPHPWKRIEQSIHPWHQDEHRERLTVGRRFRHDDVEASDSIAGAQVLMKTRN